MEKNKTEIKKRQLFQIIIIIMTRNNNQPVKIIIFEIKKLIYIFFHNFINIYTYI